MRRGGRVTGSPVLIGVVTTLIVIVSVFLAYNANQGLPFVPTYELRAEVPNAANLVVGNDIRVGGARVGIVRGIEPVREEDGATRAILDLRLEQRLDPLPEDSTLVIRSRSALGLKYVELTPGESARGLPPGSTLPITGARPRPVEFDEFLNAFPDEVRLGSQRSLEGFGDGLAGRGGDINSFVTELRPLLDRLEPVATNLADPASRLARLFPALARTAAEVAPVAETQASLVIGLDVTFTALAEVARPFLQETISRSVPAQEAAISELPLQRPFLRNATALSRELRPGLAVLPPAARDLADSTEIGARVLGGAPAFNRRVAGAFRAVRDFAEEPLVPPGIARLRQLAESARPTVSFLAPAQTVCNYVTLWFRNISSLLSEGDANGTWQRFIIISTPQGPNNEGGPSSAPASGPTQDNHLHANPYPNTAAPGQPRECEAGNEDYILGRTTIGNVPGNQGTLTSGQADEEEEEE